MKSSRTRTIALVVCVFAAGAIAAACWLGLPPFLEWWSGVPAVRTFAELRAARRLDLGGGVTVRLGIEAQEAPSGGGLLVYCLAEGYRDPHSSLDGRLGPLTVEIGDEGEPEVDLDLEYLFEDFSATRHDSQDTPAPNHGSEILHIRTVWIESGGSTRVRFLDRERALVRETTVRASAAGRQPWSPLALAPAHDLQKRGEPLAIRLLGGVVGAAAVPNFCAGVRAVGPGSGAASDLLPRLATLAPTDALRLVPEPEGRLTLESATLLDLSSPEDRFLARWWVNGVPRLAAPGKKPWPMVRRHGIATPRHSDRAPEPLRIEVSIDPARSGVRAGDRVELQLLYCDAGWRYVRGRDLLNLPSAVSMPRLLVSNRAGIVVSWSLSSRVVRGAAAARP